MNQCEKDLNTALAALKAEFLAFKEKMDERHERYRERDESRKAAVEAAQTAIKEQTSAAFIASKDAIVKAEEAQKAYNQSHNDLAKKLDSQNQATMPRVETENRFKAMEEKVALLTGSFTAGSGAAQGAQSFKQETRANISLIVAVIGSVMGVGGVLAAVVMFVVKGAP